MSKPKGMSWQTWCGVLPPNHVYRVALMHLLGAEKFEEIEKLYGDAEQRYRRAASMNNIVLREAALTRRKARWPLSPAETKCLERYRAILDDPRKYVNENRS